MAYNLFGLADQAQRQLLTNPGMTLSQLSGHLGVARHTVTKALHARFGRSYRQCRREALLMWTAKLLFEEHPRSIKEIALTLGYKSPKAFARFVRNAWGLSPRDFRNKAGLSSLP